ncbi:MAG: 50S ribosomal protein L17 [Coraliomargaritaceae bacterium]
MRHSKRRHILGVSGPHRSAMMGNLSVALITHGRIETTLSKAKALRPFIEKVITLAKKAEQANDAARKLHFRRLAISRVRDKKAVAKLFDELVSEFMDRTGGYTRIYKLGQRVGDAAEMALIEFIDGSDEGYEKSRTSTTAKKSEASAVEADTSEEVSAEESNSSADAALEENSDDSEEEISTEESSADADDEASEEEFKDK